MVSGWETGMEKFNRTRTPFVLLVKPAALW